MHEVLLIKRVNLKKDMELVEKIHFLLEDMEDEAKVSQVLDAIFQEKAISIENVVVKYNGISMSMKIKEIPDIIKILTDRGIKIYGVNILYDKEK